MAAALSASALHRLAKQHVPNLPIRPESTWVAVLNHTCKVYNDIKDGDSFIWIKANKNITVRTLQYHYYQRHPLEDLVLQFRDGVPNELTTVGEFRNFRPHDNLIVFRALEADSVTEEALRRGIEFNSKQKLAGRDPEHGISLDSDEESDAEPVPLTNGLHDRSEEEFESESEEEDDRSQGEEIEDEEEEHIFEADADVAREETGRDAISKQLEPEVLVISDDEDEDVQPDSNGDHNIKKEAFPSELQPEIAAVEAGDNGLDLELPGDRFSVVHSRAVSEATHVPDHQIISTPKGVRDAETEAVDEHIDSKGRASPLAGFAGPHLSNSPPPPPPQTVAVNSLEEFERGKIPSGVLARIGNLDRDSQTAIYSASTLQCENWECRLPIRIKPWTCVGPSGGLLCTSCSRVWLLTHGVATAVPALDAALEKEQRRKAELDATGYSQCMDYDAPLKVPYEWWRQGFDCQPLSAPSPNTNAQVEETTSLAAANTIQHTAEAVQYGPHDYALKARPPSGYAPYYQSTNDSSLSRTQPNRYAQAFRSAAQSTYNAFNNVTAPFFSRSDSFSAAYNGVGNGYEDSRPPSPTPLDQARLDFSTSPEPEPEPELESMPTVPALRESPVLGNSPPRTLTFGHTLVQSPNYAQRSPQSHGTSQEHDYHLTSSATIDSNHEQEMQQEDEESEENDEDYIFDQEMKDAGAMDNPKDEDYVEDSEDDGDAP